MTHFENVIAALKGIKTEEIVPLIDWLIESRDREELVYTCGNGGSAATAIHFASDLRSIGIRAWDLLSPSKLTQLGNDSDFSTIFSQQREEGTLIAFSCSGTSSNILATLQKWDFLVTSRLAPAYTLCNMIIVPSVDYEVIEDVHLAICHAVKKALM